MAGRGKLAWCLLLLLLLLSPCLLLLLLLLSLCLLLLLLLLLPCLLMLLILLMLFLLLVLLVLLSPCLLMLLVLLLRRRLHHTAAAPAFLTPGAPQLLTLMGIQSLELRVLLHLIGRHLQHHAHPEQHLLLLLGQLGLGQQLRLAPEPPCQNFPTRLGAVAVAWGHIGVAMYCFEAPQLMVHVHPLSLNVTNGPLKA